MDNHCLIIIIWSFRSTRLVEVSKRYRPCLAPQASWLSPAELWCCRPCLSPTPVTFAEISAASVNVVLRVTKIGTDSVGLQQSNWYVGVDWMVFRWLLVSTVSQEWSSILSRRGWRHSISVSLQLTCGQVICQWFWNFSRIVCNPKTSV